MTSSETFLYWIGIYVMFICTIGCLGWASYSALKPLARCAERYYTARRIIFAMGVVHRWERRNELAG